MFLKKTPHANNKIYLSIVKGYRDPKTKKAKQKTVRSLGYLDELKKVYDDPIAHFTQVAKKMTEAEKTDETIDLTLNKNIIMSTDTNDIKNIGFTALSKLYHKLAIHKFLINRECALNYQYPLNNIMKLLVYDRILNPKSKLAAFEHKDHYIENFTFPLETLYRSLRVFTKYKDKLLLDVHENVRMHYGRDTTNVFYYCCAKLKL